jgi:hypothetical protein
MDTDKEESLQFLGREIAQNLSRMGSVELAQALARLGGTPMLPAGQTELPACGLGTPKIGCENLLYAPITVARFYRGGRTNIDQVVEGQIPVAPGSSVVLAQPAHPPWATGCYVLRYRLATPTTTTTSRSSGSSTPSRSTRSSTAARSTTTTTP